MTDADIEASKSQWKREVATHTKGKKLTFDRNYVIESGNGTAKSCGVDDDGAGGTYKGSDEETLEGDSQAGKKVPRHQRQPEPHRWDPFSVLRRC